MRFPVQSPEFLQTKHVKSKIVLVGEVGVGKTSLIERFVLDTFEDRYVATVGTKVTKKTVGVTWRGVPANLDMLIWDIMGERGFRVLLRDAYFEGAQGVLAVCDITRKDTLFDLNNWINLVKKQEGNLPMVFLGNKSDLGGQAVVREEDIARFGRVHSSPWFMTSAKTGENVEVAFRKVAEAIAARSDAS